MAKKKREGGELNQHSHQGLISLPRQLPGFPADASGKEPACQCRETLRCGFDPCGFDPWVRKIPCRRKWLPIPVFLPGESHGQRSLAGYNPWGHSQSDMTPSSACFLFVCFWEPNATVSDFLLYPRMGRRGSLKHKGGCNFCRAPPSHSASAWRPAPLNYLLISLLFRWGCSPAKSESEWNIQMRYGYFIIPGWNIQS